jgi:signal transduction histidine kinase
MYRMLGVDSKHRRQKPLLLDDDDRLLSEESHVRARAAVEASLADGSPHELDLEIHRPDGTSGWVTARGEPVRDASGNIVAINGTFTDITKVKELQRLRDEWTSVIAHDLRQPIGTIMMASAMLPELVGENMTDEARAFLDRIHAASGSLKRMVDDLLDMSLLESNRLKLERTWVSPIQLVDEAIAKLGNLAGIERVHVEADRGVRSVFADPMRLEQVLFNLISNAIKYGDADADVIVRVTRNGSDAEISVTNRGRGIPPDELPRLFDRFVRSKATRGSGVAGLGLGLYIARGIVQSHNGRLWVESTPGEETTFHVVLPMSAEARKAA